MKNTIEYTAIELCEYELNGIDEKTFRRNKAYYIQKLEERYHVANGKRGRFTTYILTPKEQSQQQKADADFMRILGFDIGRNNIELMKFLLKTLLERKIVPTRKELVKLAKMNGFKVSEGTIKNYMGGKKGLFYKNDVLVPPMAVPVWVNDEPLEAKLQRVDRETGELPPTYYKVLATYIYYDYADDDMYGSRKRLGKLTQDAIDKAYNTIRQEEYQRIIVPMIKSKVEWSIIETVRRAMERRVLHEVGKSYGLKQCERIMEHIFNPFVASQLRQYFKLDEQEQRNMDIQVDVSDLRVVHVNRRPGERASEEVNQMDYHMLLKSRVNLYKKQEDALPLELYEKWHGLEFGRMLNSSTDVKTDDVPKIDVSESYEKHQAVSEVALEKCEEQLAPTKGNDELDKKIIAFKFKLDEEKTETMAVSAMAAALLKKRRGA